MNTIELDRPHETIPARFDHSISKEASNASLLWRAEDTGIPKVLLVMWSIPHYRMPIFSRLTRNPTIDFIVAAGEDITMYDGSKVVGPTEDEASTLNWRRIVSKRLRWPLRKWEWQPEAVKMVMSGEFDCVIVFGNRSLSNYLVKLICAMRRIPVMEWSQGVLVRERGLKRILRNLYMRQADALLLYGDFARDFFIEQGFAPERVHAVHNSLDYDRQVAIRESLDPRDIERTRRELGVYAPEQRLIVHSGRLEAFKKIPILFEAIREMKNRGREVILSLVGTGREEQALMTRAKEYGIDDRVKFCGALYDEEILARMYSAADLCVVPGPAGLVVMHVMVYGTPVLTYAGWQMPEVEAVIEAKTGAYYREGDLEHMVTRMEEMLYPRTGEEPHVRCLHEYHRRALDTGLPGTGDYRGAPACVRTAREGRDSGAGDGDGLSSEQSTPVWAMIRQNCNNDE